MKRRVEPASPSAPIGAIVATLGAAAVAVFTFRGALGQGFSQDDFLGLARATGLVERLTPGWRWLSHQLWWDLVAGPLAADPRAAHALSVMLMAGIAALLAWLIARRMSAPAALIGAAFVASHPSAYTAVHWVAANGDLLATLLSLGAIACLAAGGRVRVLAPVLHLGALLAKESAIASPLVWVVLVGFAPQFAPRAPRPWRDPVWYVCLGLSLFAAVTLARSPALGGEAYGMRWSAVPGNLASYTGWLVDRWFGSVRGWSDAPDPRALLPALGAGIVWAALACVPGLRARGWLAAGLAWCVALAPVLLLANHTYHYYMTFALPVAGLAVAALAAWSLTSVPVVARWGLAALLACVMALDGHALVTRIATMPFDVPGSLADPLADRARIAENAIADLRSAAPPAGSVLRLWSPQVQAMAASAGTPAHEIGYHERNVRAALLDGLALRVAVRTLDSAVFVRAFDPADARAQWAVYRYDGHLRVIGADSLRRVLANAPH